MNELTNNKTTNEGSRIFSTTENNNVVWLHNVDKIKEQEMAIDGLCGTIDQLQKEISKMSYGNKEWETTYNVPRM